MAQFLTGVYLLVPVFFGVLALIGAAKVAFRIYSEARRLDSDGAELLEDDPPGFDGGEQPGDRDLDL